MKKHTIFYRRPAGSFAEAMPVGSGFLGAMPLGEVFHERINLNEDTFWSGYPRANGLDNAYERVTKRLRKKIREGLFEEAEDLADKLQGPYSESYLSVGELRLDCPQDGEITDYTRGLDIPSGISYTAYQCGGVSCRRELFASFPDGVIVLHITADKAGQITFSGTLSSMIRHRTYGSGGRLFLSAKAPRHVEPIYLENGYGDSQAIVYDEEWEDPKGLCLLVSLEPVVTGGTLRIDDNGFRVEGADEVVLYLHIGTDYNRERFSPGSTGWHTDAEELPARSKTVLDDVVKKGYDAVLKAHLDDMTAYFNRVTLELPYDEALDALPTDERLRRYREGHPDTGLETLFFDFGRYLLYSCSRPGSQAANLQGIWCWQVRPPWSCNYTVNINTQMNYWGAEVLNLADCHLPLIDLVEEISHTGAETAASLYQARGFCVHHNLDLWRSGLPIGMGHSDCKWSLFPTAGIWLSLHIWEHYRFTRDIAFLKNRYPLLKGAALFAADMMCEQEDGTLGLCPATVPERRFRLSDGQSFAVGSGSTFDYELINELFSAVEEAASLAGDDDVGFLSEIDRVRGRFPSLPLEDDGTLREWQFEAEAEDYLWVDVLFGLFPGNCLLTGSDRLKEAAAKTLKKRDKPYPCFSTAWSAGAWARLGDGKTAYDRLHYLIARAVFDSLLGCNVNASGGAFQIDVNLGGIAAMAELLIQSDENGMILLPALPTAWRDGRVTGLRTRCGYTVDMTWTNGELTEAILKTKNREAVSVKIGNTVLDVLPDKSDTIRIVKKEGTYVSDRSFDL